MGDGGRADDGGSPGIDPASGPLPVGSPSLPRDFRKLSIEERRSALRAALRATAEPDAREPYGTEEGLEWADAMVESAVGFLPVPIGIATGFRIDGRNLSIPMAVEEPSVIAAATFAGTLIASAGGIVTWATPPEMVSQIFLQETGPDGGERLRNSQEEVAREIEPLLASMKARGGGYRGMTITPLEEIGLLRVDLRIDVRDAMGANIINTAAESVRAKVEALTGGRALMCILTNESAHRRAGARFSLPLSRLARGGFTGREAGRRIERASEVAQVDPSRAVTHNKGVMNGISALALATGNDTRGVEAAVHRWASRDGRYRGVSTFHVEEDRLVGRIEVPLPLATAGGSIGFHPSTRASLGLLGNPDSQTLARIGAALGLAQNFAAVHALVTEGIQKGHMRMHSARLALIAGARGPEVRKIAEQIAESKSYTIAAARELLSRLRSEGT